MKNNKPICYLPNIITASRIIASLLLCIFQTTSVIFISLYIFCGITDMADGFLARKLNCKTNFGSVMDSLADTVFTLCVAVKLFPLIDFRLWLIVWLCIIVVARIAALLICLARFNKLRVLHTNTNKATGLVVFALLLPFCLLSWQWCAVVGCAVASVAAIEEILRMSFSKEIPTKE